MNVNGNDPENSDRINWTVKPAEGKPGISLLPAETPETLAELQKAAEIYGTQDMVYAFVVMEDKPLAESHTSRALVSAQAEKALAGIEAEDVKALVCNVAPSCT